MNDTDWIEAADNYVNVHAHGVSNAHGEEYVVRQTLWRMEEALSSRGFVRIHRSAIVNIARIREIQPWFGGEYVVLLRCGTKVAGSRAYRPNLQALLE